MVNEPALPYKEEVAGSNPASPTYKIPAKGLFFVGKERFGKRIPALLLQPDWNEGESTRQGGVRDDRKYPQEYLLAGHTRMEWSELVQTRNEKRSAV